MSKTINAKTSIALAAAVAAALSIAAAGQANAEEMEKCYGIAKAGMNDCKAANGSCAGTAKMDHQADTFIAVPKGTCAKIAGGSLEPGMMK